MASKAKLPSETVQERLNEAIELAGELESVLDEIENDDAWRIWNLGGAAFGRPQFKGPGYWTAEEFALYARRLRERLESVEESFEHRRRYVAEKAEKRREARQA